MRLRGRFQFFQGRRFFRSIRQLRLQRGQQFLQRRCLCLLGALRGRFLQILFHLHFQKRQNLRFLRRVRSRSADFG